MLGRLIGKLYQLSYKERGHQRNWESNGKSSFSLLVVIDLLTRCIRAKVGTTLKSSEGKVRSEPLTLKDKLDLFERYVVVFVMYQNIILNTIL